MKKSVRSNYGSIHASVVTSSLMEEPIPARYLFFMFVSQTDDTGFVRGTDLSLSRLFNMKLEDFREMVGILESPDTKSSSPEYEGSRLKKVQGGWLVLNYRKYRGNSLYGKRATSLNGKNGEHTLADTHTEQRGEPESKKNGK
jgi:hypothetical protein